MMCVWVIALYDVTGYPVTQLTFEGGSNSNNGNNNSAYRIRDLMRNGDIVSMRAGVCRIVCIHTKRSAKINPFVLVRRFVQQTSSQSVHIQQ